MNTTPPATTAAPAPILTLAPITALPPSDRVSLYRKCDDEMRGRFLIQGKVLHTLGAEGEQLLRKAGVPASSLSNARYAQLAFSLADGKRKLHTGKKAIPFDEAVYDTLTFEQCQLLAYGSTYRGSARTVQHRPSPETFEAILKLPEWDAELESYFADGGTREMVKAAQASAAELAKALQATPTPMPIAPTAEAAPLPADTALPGAPVIVSMPPPSDPPAPALAEEATTSDTPSHEAPSNVVAFPQTIEAAPSAASSPAIEPEDEEDPSTDFTGETGPITGDLGVTAAEWMGEFETLEAMSRQFAPDIQPGDRIAMATRLRALAEEISAPAGASSPELPQPKAPKASGKPAKATKKTKSAA